MYEHLITTTQVTREQVESDLFPLADELRSGHVQAAVLAGRSLYCLFYEPSFLTRTSFERAVELLGGDSYHTEDASQFFPFEHRATWTTSSASWRACISIWSF